MLLCCHSVAVPGFCGMWNEGEHRIIGMGPGWHGREVAKPMAVPFPQVQGQIAGPQ